MSPFSSCQSRLDEDDVVLADPDALLHPPGMRGPLFPVRTAHADPVCAEHLDDLREHLVLVGHPEIVSTAAVSIAHAYAVIRAPGNKGPLSARKHPFKSRRRRSETCATPSGPKASPAS